MTSKSHANTAKATTFQCSLMHGGTPRDKSSVHGQPLCKTIW